MAIIDMFFGGDLTVMNRPSMAQMATIGMFLQAHFIQDGYGKFRARTQNPPLLIRPALQACSAAQSQAYKMSWCPAPCREKKSVREWGAYVAQHRRPVFERIGWQTAGLVFKSQFGSDEEVSPGENTFFCLKVVASGSKKGEHFWNLKSQKSTPNLNTTAYIYIYTYIMHAVKLLSGPRWPFEGSLSGPRWGHYLVQVCFCTIK